MSSKQTGCAEAEFLCLSPADQVACEQRTKCPVHRANMQIGIADHEAESASCLFKMNGGVANRSAAYSCNNHPRVLLPLI